MTQLSAIDVAAAKLGAGSGTAPNSGAHWRLRAFGLALPRVKHVDVDAPGQRHLGYRRSGLLTLGE